jgi:hypothetical protein
MAVSAEARLHRGVTGDPKPPSFVTGTAGLGFNW